MEKVRYVVNIVIAVLLLVAVAVNRDARVFGTDLRTVVSEQKGSIEAVELVASEGVRVVNSTDLVKEVSGYGGATPIHMYIRAGVIEKIVPLKNGESPDFMLSVTESGLLNSWDGLSLDDALAKQVDAVSGATLSSTALIATVRQTLSYAAAHDLSTSSTSFESIGLKGIAGVVVIVLGVLCSFVRSPRLRMAQMVLNVVVLGFWCGSFLSLSQLVNWCSSGVNLSVSLVPLLLLVVALLLPLFSRKGHYCAWHCPMGAFQELLSKVVRQKWTVSNGLNRVLTYFREFLLWGLLLCMWLGVGFSWMDYEVFSAFLFQSAGTVVLVMAVSFLLLSLKVNRPYCRFVCPTGSLLRFTTTNK